MPLNWNVSNVKDWQNIKKEGLLGVQNAIIWSTIAVGLGEITEENVKQWVSRLDFVQKIAGPFLYQPSKNGKHGKEIPITEEHVRRFIGLRCNVSNDSRAQFIKRWTRDVL